MPCLLFSSLGAAASTLEPRDGSGIELIDSAWHAVIEFQRQVNAGVAIHMRALETGNSFAAFFNDIVHSLGPGHGKFVIMSNFMGREVYVLRGLVMAIQVAVIHVIAAIGLYMLYQVIRGFRGHTQTHHYTHDHGHHQPHGASPTPLKVDCSHWQSVCSPAQALRR